MSNVLESGLWGLVAAVIICVIAISTKGCYVANQSQLGESARACIASQRPAIDCTLILRGTGTP